MAFIPNVNSDLSTVLAAVASLRDSKVASAPAAPQADPQPVGVTVPDDVAVAPADSSPAPISRAAAPAAPAVHTPDDDAEPDPLVPTAAGRAYKKRQYQLDAMAAAVEAVVKGYRRILLVAPTGTGKNHMTALILSARELRDHFGVADGEDLRVMYFAHKHELLVQGRNEIGTLPGVELIPQSIFSPIPQEVLDKGWHFSIHDEAHHEPMLSFQAKLGYISDAQMLGLTATPERADKFSLKFDAVLTAISREEAVAQGYLAPATVHSVVDMGVQDKPDLLSDLVDEYGSRMERTLVYLKTKDQAQRVHRMLLSKGYRSALLVAVSRTERDAIKYRFEAGELDFVVNCQMLDEGVDFRGVKGVVVARGVQSGPLLNQIIGRAARIDEPECHIWQFVDPLRDNLDACAIVGKNVDHFLYYISGGKWHCDQMSVATMVDGTGGLEASAPTAPDEEPAVEAEPVALEYSAEEAA